MSSHLLPPFADDNAFSTCFKAAAAGVPNALEELWLRMVGRMGRSKQEPGLAYITMVESLCSYDRSLCQTDKPLRWHYWAFVAHRIRKATQTQIQRMEYPVCLSDRQHRTMKKAGTLPTVGECTEDLAAEPLYWEGSHVEEGIHEGV